MSHHLFVAYADDYEHFIMFAIPYSGCPYQRFFLRTQGTRLYVIEV